MTAHGTTSVLDLRPGLVLGTPETTAPVKVVVRTDVACFLRVMRLPVAPDLEGDGVQRMFVKALPGSPEGAACFFSIRHQFLDRWDEQPFRGEFRTRQPAQARIFFRNDGRQLHLLDLSFWVPPFDPADLPEALDPELVAEEREAAAFLKFYAWALERLDDYGEGAINQVALPELWTSQVHLLPQVWATVASFCRRTGNRFFLADCAPPLRILQQEEQRRAEAEGVELDESELCVEALVPWFRPERWAEWEHIPTEVALTLDAVEAARTELGRDDTTLASMGVYWPWLRDLKGLDLPPCGAVAGVFARSDTEGGDVGVMEPPANEDVKGLLDLTIHLEESYQALLRREAINLLHTRVGRGVVVWGARTLCEDRVWRFVNVRRLMGYIGKQLEVDHQWAVFENNDESLRQRVARDTRYFLTDLWEKGALSGETPDEAFEVLCSDENNPDEVSEAGNLVVDVWVHPVQTNEYVHLKMTFGDDVID